MGERFKLSDVKKEADTLQIISFKNKSLRISTWTGLQTVQFMDIPLMMLKLEFLDSTGKPVFDKPIWLVTTATTLDPETIARAYLWRASHELTFRFMKQHLGLTKNNSPELKPCDAWVHLVALAMNCLLAIRDDLQIQAKPWYPQKLTKPVSQQQAQTHALPFSSSYLPLPILHNVQEKLQVDSWVTSLIQEPSMKLFGKPLNRTNLVQLVLSN